MPKECRIEKRTRIKDASCMKNPPLSMPNRAYSDSDHFPYVKHFENLPDVSAPTKKSDLRQLRYSCIQTQLVKQITRSI